MRRPANEASTLERIRAWRKICPELTIRSTFIVGFPGETEEDFGHLLDWLEEAGLDRVGCFRYEDVAGAAANDLPGHVPDELRQERWERFMEAAGRISERRLARKIGRRLEVIVDEVDAEGAVCRTQGDAPEIDGALFVEEPGALRPGDIATVEVTDASDYDLWGRLA
jgi:ribosomal protein S12 methylthiotransferase